MRQYDEALSHWRQVQAANPENPEASRMIAALVIERSRRQAGLPRSAALDLAISPAAQATPEFRLLAPAAASLADSTAGVRLSRVQQLETAIKGEDANVDVYLELARLYLEKGRDYEAERLLSRAREATGRNPQVLCMAEDVAMLRQEKRVQAAQRDVELEDSAKTRAALAQMVRQRDELEISVFLERSRRDADDLSLKYELGRRLVWAGRPAEARQFLELALEHPPSRPRAALELAACSVASSQAPEALRNYRLAASAAIQSGDENAQAEALFAAAQLARRLKLNRLARRYLAQLMQVAPSHRAGAALWESLGGERPLKRNPKQSPSTKHK